jgi:hypothetical protein
MAILCLMNHVSARHDLGQFESQQARISSGKKQRDAQSVWRELISLTYAEGAR